MARINVVGDEPDVDAPWLVEGLPGVGLVGKIAADHLIDAFEMRHFANVHCEGVPRVAVYAEGDADLRTPIRLYADEGRNLLALQSDIPVSPDAAAEFAECLSAFYEEHDATPVYLSGVPREKGEDAPGLYGVGAGDGAARLAEIGIDVPSETGLISGPTGALLSHAVETDQTAVGLIVESDPRFPDPEASRVIIDRGIEPLIDVEVPVDNLVERAEEIREARERLAREMQDGEESTAAQPLRMYQ